MNEILKAIAENFLSLLVVIAAVGILYVIFQQYLKIHDSIDKKISEAVSARIGEILGSLQIEITRAEIFSKDQKTKLDEISEHYEKLVNDIDKKHAEAAKLFGIIEDKFSAIISSIPDVSDYSVDDILSRAESTSGLQSAQFCKMILDHDDSSSSTLERAGDIMRDASRYTLARDLYERACSLDPERVGVRVEHACLSAQIDPKDRKRNLDLAINSVLESPNVVTYIRTANVLISLGKFSDLLNFSQSVLDKIADGSVELKSACLRNLGTAHKRLNNNITSLEYHLNAFELTPNDENAVRLYAMSLQDSGKYNEYIELRKKLILMDPLDFNYRERLISALLKVDRFDEAISWLTASEKFAISPADQHLVTRFRLRIEAALAVKQLVENAH